MEYCSVRPLVLLKIMIVDSQLMFNPNINNGNGTL